MLSNASATGTSRRLTISNRGCHGSGRTSARHSARTSTTPACDPRTHTPRLNPSSRLSFTVAHASSQTSRRRVSAQSWPGSGRPPGSPQRSPSPLTCTTASRRHGPRPSHAGCLVEPRGAGATPPPVLTVAGNPPGNTVRSDAHAPSLHASLGDIHPARRKDALRGAAARRPGPGPGPQDHRLERRPHSGICAPGHPPVPPTGLTRPHTFRESGRGP
jgi:hypothetical protein